MNELTLASFAAASDSTSSASRAAARFAAFKARVRPRAELERLRRARLPLPRPLRSRRFRRCCGRSTTRRRVSSSAATRTPRCWRGPRSPIVGARACSAYGRQIARSLGRELAAAGLVVVSGLARGIDAEAHRGALEAAGATVAVLGCGIDRDYPAAHRELARQIAATGLVVSEYAPGVEPAPWRFPARNRIVAGLCAATVVVEARERSGALITADFALEEGREVLGGARRDHVARSRAGSNALLRLGATPLTCAQDVLESYRARRDRRARTPELGETAAARARAGPRRRCKRRRARRARRPRRRRLGRRADRARAGRRRQRGGGCLSCCQLASPRG